ncbi:MAG TPA: tetratricopeptide repeat protein [Bacteroidales bacterium]|nr:tetratricopeptide repeat protein [Bacteroidales bacterium]
MSKIKNWITDNYWRFSFYLFITIALFMTIRLSMDAGYSGDEDFHIKHAKAVYDFYATGGKDTTAITLSDDWNLPHYGQTVDNIAYTISKWFSIEDQVMVRHITNAVFGWTLLLLGGLIAFRISGQWRTAMIVAALMFLSPRLLGHTFNNIKDTGLAVGMFFGLYSIIVFLQDFPKIKIKTLILLALSIGFAIGVRIGGLLLIPYLGFFGLIYFIKMYSFKGLFQPKTSKLFGKMVLYGAITAIVGYGIALLIWPYGLVDPIAHTLDTFKAQSQFGTALRQLFEGELQWSDKLPWYYTPKYILMTIPVAVILGLFTFFVFLWRDRKNWFWYFVIFFAFFFPVFWIVYTNANVYGGWRHALFSYPPMVVAAGLGFNLFIQFFEDERAKLVNTSKEKYWKWAQKVALFLPFIMLIPPLSHIIRNHPYEYVYFNEFIGGMDKAYGNYEGDYYYHSSKEASEWVLNNAQKPTNPNEKIKVVSWHFASLNYYFRNDTAQFATGFARWYEKGNIDWDYAVFTVTGMAPEQITNSAVFPPPNTVHTITVDGKPIAFVIKRMDKSDFIGYTLKEEKKYDSAILFLQKAIQLDPTNEAAHVNIIECYFNLQKLDSAKLYIDKLLAFVPKYETANFFLVNYYMAQNQLDEALKVTKKIIRDNMKFKAAYHLGFQIYVRKNDLRGAEKMMVSLMRAEQMDQQGVQQLVSLYKAQGMDDRTAYKRIYKMLVRTYEELGKEKEASDYREVLNQL